MGRNKAFLLAGCLVWLLGVGSMVGVHLLLKPRVREPAFLPDLKQLMSGIAPEIKQGLSRYENIVIRTGPGGKFRLLGNGFEDAEEKLFSENLIAVRNLEFRIDDPVALERKARVGEAIKTLNNAEKNCLANGYGAIIYRAGAYHFIVNKKIYEEYVRKFGTECATCDQLKANQGGGR
jgi:hypothetical protein